MEQTETWRRLKDDRPGGETHLHELFMMLKQTHGKQNPALDCVRFVARVIKCVWSLEDR